MPEDVSGEIRIRVLAEGAEGAGPGAAEISAAPTAAQKGPQPQEWKDVTTIIKKFIPFIAGATGLVALIKYSSLMSSTLGSIMQIVGALFDVILAPFIPLIMEMVKAVIPLLPVIAQLASQIIGSMVQTFLPLIQKIADFLQRIADWFATKKFGPAAETPAEVGITTGVAALTGAAAMRIGGAVASKILGPAIGGAIGGPRGMAIGAVVSGVYAFGQTPAGKRGAEAIAEMPLWQQLVPGLKIWEYIKGIFTPSKEGQIGGKTERPLEENKTYNFSNVFNYYLQNQENMEEIRRATNEGTKIAFGHIVEERLK